MKSQIPGVYYTPLKKQTDNRGWLCEMFRQDELPDGNFPVMAYASVTFPGITRGPHEHKEQSDLFVFMGPGDFDLILEYKGALTEERTFGISFPCAVIVPPGVIHSYKNISQAPGIVFNFPNRLYKGEGRQFPADEIRHEDLVLKGEI